MNKKDKRKDYKLRYRYGITLVQYNKLLKKQKNKCAICGKLQKDEKKSFCVDHNHRTGCIRGIICNYCNSKLLYYLRDDKNRTIGLIKYLTEALDKDKSWN